MSPRVRSRSVLQAKLLDLEIKALPKDANVDVLIADIPKGEQNQNPTKNQYSIQCPSFGLTSCTKTSCVAKKWWEIHPKNSDGSSKNILVHWSSHFKGLYDNKKILILVMKMADNHPRNVYCHHQLKHGGISFPYFDYHAKNRTPDLIQADSNVKKARVARKLTEIDSETKNRKEASIQALPDMSVCEE